MYFKRQSFKGGTIPNSLDEFNRFILRNKYNNNSFAVEELVYF